ncbi:MarR family winged helix-turn-helix transcriptional regulator [Arachidicoccus terrestris]|uniref:MarR family winged helix-turn-helix transcriptional regulator n=1 Tax=Arachidicoccus terrestris TaxID=2875539 RepID=UPI001CC7A53C|nr:MarR family transcriptional regulator [Arachidicoccus terrestris]UAY54375.1 MarR family transcriptional regulator [Arachidicoccus terrestris]
MASLYHDLGFLILGSRLRRMSEYFLAEVNKVYQELDLPFEAGWFPLFFILAREQQVSIRQAADELMTSHSAISQLVAKLKERELITSFESSEDRRVQLIGLSEKGIQLKNRLQPVWESISNSMEEMETTYPDVAHFLPAVARLEQHFESQPLSGIIMDRVQQDTRALNGVNNGEKPRKV